MSSKNNTNAGKAPETTGAAPTTGTAPEGTQAPTTGAAPEGTQATTTGAAPTDIPVPATYPVFIPLLPGKHQPDFQGSVNGVPFQLPRGQMADLPRHIYEVVMNTLTAEQRADQEYYKAQAQLLARAKEEEDRIIGK